MTIFRDYGFYCNYSKHFFPQNTTIPTLTTNIILYRFFHVLYYYKLDIAQVFFFFRTSFAYHYDTVIFWF